MGLNFSGLLMDVIGIFILLAVLGGLVFGLVYTIRLLLKIINLRQPQTTRYCIIMVICILIASASWILNMGWLRLILTWFAVPFIHPIIFVVINSKALPNIIYSAKLKIYTLITYITYVLMYVFLPDGGDIGPMYTFFGLISNDLAVNVLTVLSEVCLIAYITFTILQITENKKVKI